MSDDKAKGGLPPTGGALPDPFNNPGGTQTEDGEIPSNEEAPPFPRYPVQTSYNPSYHSSAPFLAFSTPQERFAATLRRQGGMAMPLSPLNPTASLFNPSGGINIPPPPHLSSVPSGPTVPPTPTYSVHRSAAFATPDPLRRAGNGPCVPDRGAPSTAWLSYECQRHHFNPDFRIIGSNDGRYKCNIKLQGIIVQGDEWFENMQDAKLCTASKALNLLPKLISGKPPLVISSVRGGDGRKSQEKSKVESEKKDKENDKGKQILPQQPGPVSGSAVDMTDPLQARAFVEGFRMGQLAAEQTRDRGRAFNRDAVTGGVGDRKRSRQGRNRSRTPSPSPKRRRRSVSRDRGPISASKSNRDSRIPGVHIKGWRHDHSLPSADYYRPSDESLAPADRYRPLDESYGRLNDFKLEKRD